MSNAFVIAHDLGTSGDKACIFDSECKLIATAFTPYETYFPNSGWAEQNPEEWWSAVCNSTRKVMEDSALKADDIVAISFSAQSSGCLPLDNQGKALRDKAMIWMDSRSTNQAAYILEKLGPDTQYNITGNGLGTVMQPCAKIMWIRENEPKVYENTAKFVGCKEYLIARMTGCFGKTDYTEAQSSGVFSALGKDYDPYLLGVTGIPREKLCDPMDSTEIIGSLLPQAAVELGLCQNTKVVLGMMDNPAAAVGAGCFSPGVFVTSLGTAAWMGCIDNRAFINADYHVNSTYLGFQRYRSSVNSHTVGAAFDWGIKHLLGLQGNDMYDKATELARKAPIGADGLMFLPSFRLGNCRYGSPGATGALIGMKLEHNKSHIARALFESLAYEIHIGLDFFLGQSAVPTELRLIGGGSRNPLQCQIISDILGIPVVVPENSRHIGASGAAVIALVGSGILPAFDQATNFIMKNRYEPVAENAEIYSRVFERFKACYEVLMPAYDNWAKK